MSVKIQSGEMPLSVDNDTSGNDVAIAGIVDAWIERLLLSWLREVGSLIAKAVGLSIDASASI